jgi:triphosphatase
VHNPYNVTHSPTTRKAARLQLAKDATVDAAITAIFAECFEHWTFNEAAALHGLDPEGVHQMRVALRRMRSALSDFKQVIPAAQVAWLKRETEWLIENLGPARDWDIFLIELLKPVEMARPGDTGLAELRTAAEAEQANGYEKLRIALGSRRYSVLLRRMHEWLRAGQWREGRNERRKSLNRPVQKLARQLLEKRHKRALKIGRSFEKLSVQERHRLRIALKKLRYTAEFCRSLFRKKHEKEYLHALAEVQNGLGLINDIAVADHLLEHIAASLEHNRTRHLCTAAGLVAGWHARSASIAEQEAKAIWRQFGDCAVFW